MSPQIDGMRVWADFIGLICSDFTPWIYPLAIIQATQEHPPQIGHLAAENREQFGVRAESAGRQLWPGADQVAHGLIYGTIFVGCGHNAGGIKSYSYMVT